MYRMCRPSRLLARGEPRGRTQLSVLAGGAGVDCVVVRRWAFSVLVAEALTAKRDAVVVCELSAGAARR